MKIVTKFPEGVSHVLAKNSVGNKDWYTLRKINANGYNVIETMLGALKLQMPWFEKMQDQGDSYWEIIGYFNEVEGDIVKRGLEQNSTLNGRDVMRGLRSEEMVIRIAA
jgi:hypothetical protein